MVLTMTELAPAILKNALEDPEELRKKMEQIHNPILWRAVQAVENLQNFAYENSPRLILAVAISLIIIFFIRLVSEFQYLRDTE